MDSYIDQTEASRYNDHAVRTLAALSDLSPEIPRIIEDLSAFSSRLGQVLNSAGDSRSTARTLGASRRERSEYIAQRLGRLLDKLKDQKSDGAAFDLLRLFPTGSRSDIGKSIADRQAALARALAGLAQYQAEIEDSKVWIEELTALSAEFSALVGEESVATQAKRSQGDQLTRAHSEWRRQYRAARLIVKGVLLRAGREQEWGDFFLDTQVAGSSSPSEDEPSPDRAIA